MGRNCQNIRVNEKNVFHIFVFKLSQSNHPLLLTFINNLIPHHSSTLWSHQPTNKLKKPKKCFTFTSKPTKHRFGFEGRLNTKSKTENIPQMSLRLELYIQYA